MLCDFSLIRRVNVGLCALNTRKYKEENMHCFIDLFSTAQQNSFAIENSFLLCDVVYYEEFCVSECYLRFKCVNENQHLNCNNQPLISSDT